MIRYYTVDDIIAMKPCWTDNEVRTSFTVRGLERISIWDVVGSSISIHDQAWLVVKMMTLQERRAAFGVGNFNDAYDVVLRAGRYLYWCWSVSHSNPESWYAAHEMILLQALLSIGQVPSGE